MASKNKSSFKGIKAFVCVCLSLVGLLVIFQSTRSFYYYFSYSHFHETTGQVHKSEIKKQKVDYSVSIKYSYEVNEYIYENDRVFGMNEGFNHSEAVSKMNYFKNQKPLKVYYMASSPATAILEKNFSYMEIAGFILGLLLFLPLVANTVLRNAI